MRSPSWGLRLLPLVIVGWPECPAAVFEQRNHYLLGTKLDSVAPAKAHGAASLQASGAARARAPSISGTNVRGAAGAGAGTALDSSEAPAHGKYAGIPAATMGAARWLKNSVEVLLGILVVLVAVPSLWLYERQRVKVDCLTDAARIACVSMAPGLKASLKFEGGQLAHVAGEEARPAAPIKDPRFAGVVIAEGCLRLRTNVQVFPWDGANAAHGRHGKALGQGAAPPGLAIGTTTTNCGCVEYGGSFVLPDGLVDQLHGFRDAGGLLGEKVTTVDGRYVFLKYPPDGCFYCRPARPGCSSDDIVKDPCVGDVRARFEYVPPGLVTILALQVESDLGMKGTFLPFRLVPSSLCGMNKSEERIALVREARKPREQLAREGKCLEGYRVCCGCNLVSGWCSGVFTPEIFRCFEGTRSLDQCLQVLDASPSRSVGYWLYLLGWGVTYMGLLFASSKVPLSLLSDALVLPAMGTLERPAMCLIATSALWALMLALAYLPYQRSRALGWFIVVIALVVVPGVMAMPAAKE